MNIICPSCGSKIAMDDINVSTDIALCRNCGRNFSYSELVAGTATAGADLNAPPSGAWFQELPGGFRVGATTRSWMALFLVPFTCVWSGISMSGIYGTQIRSGHFDPGSSLFGLPFLIGTFFLVGMCVMNVAGRVELALNGDNLSVFIGVGPVGWKRTYLWSEFSSVREGFGSNTYNWNRQPGIVLEGKRRLAFGSMLSEQRRYFVLSVLRKMLRNSNRGFTSASVTPPFR